MILSQFPPADISFRRRRDEAGNIPEIIDKNRTASGCIFAVTAKRSR
jgi:hypothetical protein